MPCGNIEANVDVQSGVRSIIPFSLCPAEMSSGLRYSPIAVLIPRAFYSIAPWFIYVTLRIILSTRGETALFPLPIRAYAVYEWEFQPTNLGAL